MKHPVWILRGEAILLRLLSFLVVVVLISQLFLFQDRTRAYLSKVDQLEGNPIDLGTGSNSDVPVHIRENMAVITDYQNILRKGRKLQFKLIVPDKSEFVFLLINGKRMSDFRNGTVDAVVYQGDYVALDTTMLKSPVKIMVNTQSTDIATITDGLLLEGKGEIITLGKISFTNK